MGRIPRAAFPVALGAIVGVAGGLGGFTFIHAEGGSYLSNDPAACANCHVMNEQLEGWSRSSHHAVAVCNDCHAPHDFIGKYATKAINGWNHSLAFTTGNFPAHMRITERNREVTQGACRSCHAAVVDAIDHTATNGEPLDCIRCHRSVGHLH